MLNVSRRYKSDNDKRCKMAVHNHLLEWNDITWLLTWFQMTWGQNLHYFCIKEKYRNMFNLVVLYAAMFAVEHQTKMTFTKAEPLLCKTCSLCRRNRKQKSFATCSEPAWWLPETAELHEWAQKRQVIRHKSPNCFSLLTVSGGMSSPSGQSRRTDRPVWRADTESSYRGDYGPWIRATIMSWRPNDRSPDTPSLLRGVLTSLADMWICHIKRADIFAHTTTHTQDLHAFLRKLTNALACTYASRYIKYSTAPQLYLHAIASVNIMHPETHVCTHSQSYIRLNRGTLETLPQFRI